MSEVLHVFRFDTDWFVAYSEADALAAYREHYVKDVKAIDDAECDAQLEFGCVELADDSLLRILCDENGAISDNGEAVERTCGDWACRQGRGFLCSSEF